MALELCDYEIIFIFMFRLERMNTCEYGISGGI